MIERYGIYWANLDPVIGAEMKKKRPVVVVSMNPMNAGLDTIVACPLTSTLHPKWRTRIQIICGRRHAEIAVDQIRTLSKKRIGKILDRLSNKESAEIIKLITEMYGLP
jgi:mRNA interferase MazF